MRAARCTVIAVTVLWATLAACSAPALAPELAAAESAERAGDYPSALSAYQDAQESCTRVRSPRLRQETCAAAYLQHAELLDRMGERRAAAQAYERIPATLPGAHAAAATATYNAGKLHLALGQDQRGYTLLWRTITDYPGEAAAGDALRAVVRDGRRRDPGELYRVLGTLIQHLAQTDIGDNLLYVMADIAEHELEDARAAQRLYDKIIVDYPASGLRDDAFWHAARLARGMGDAQGAVRRLRALLATREVAHMVGSYFSIWLDDAQLELGRILRDDLHSPQAAIRAFARLPALFPDSVLRDDATWELAVTWDQLGNRAQTCAALRRLDDAWPESRYQLTLAPALRARHQCVEAKT